MAQSSQNASASLQVSPPRNPPRRVKVYELKNQDWVDRGTGFCTGLIANDIPLIQVRSEEQEDQLLLETKICAEDGYQKQQETLIVWTEQSGTETTDMALSFQEADGCAAIWEFVNSVQTQMLNSGVSDLMGDDLADSTLPTISLPDPDLGTLADVEIAIRNAGNTAQGRDALAKYIANEGFIGKLLPLLEVAEDLESLTDLHRLCNILKLIILLNDNIIIEYLVTDEAIMNVVGILEYDPDFPSHKANHRQYLSDLTKFKEVVKFDNPEIRQKIHATYRLQYLKDVVLARILDDPTFSILNSLIFFNQVDIINYVQSAPGFLGQLFGIFKGEEEDESRRKNGVLFLQQCCSIAKTLQVTGRAQLYTAFLANGLLDVVDYALTNEDATVRIAGTEILMNLIDHDPLWMRSLINRQISEKQKPLTDTLISLLLANRDLGIKAQIADAIKVLLDPQAQGPQGEGGSGSNQKASDNFAFSKFRSSRFGDSETESFLQSFYDISAAKLFFPLMELDKRDFSKLLSVAEVQLYNHLVEILCFFVRQHLFRSKYFILSENLPQKIALLLRSSEKQLKLAALKFFRTCIGLQDEFYIRQMIKYQLFEPILNVVVETMPKDNLLNSAALEFFDYIKRVSEDSVNVRVPSMHPGANVNGGEKSSLKPAINHMVEQYRDRLQEITYVETFQLLIQRYDQWHDTTVRSTVTTEEAQANGKRWAGQAHDLDAAEEEYFNASDEEELMAVDDATAKEPASSPVKPLVEYADDEEDEQPTTPSKPAATADDNQSVRSRTPPTPRTSPDPLKPITSISEKRRRQEEEDEDALVQLSARKRRASTSSQSAPPLQLNIPTTPTATNGSEAGSPTSNASTPSRKRAAEKDVGGVKKKISISLGAIGKTLGVPGLADLGSPIKTEEDNKNGIKKEDESEDGFEKVEAPKKEESSEEWVEVSPPPTSTEKASIKTEVKEEEKTSIPEPKEEVKDGPTDGIEKVEVIHRKEVEA
ncbi:DUF625-domain-containing protein [Ascobolus immersus RN42]|uniref:DUF625-domain-containing protein n=1 Tax=Ascobolus immersus RN42 TaxID=1160509 RepID=A0A3N4ICI6_ASCIM|nr:DUF625-domain-containing protein [Ascobolus immersus RN42]